METIKRKCVFLIDLLAVTVLIGLIAGYYNIITHSVNVGDESFYICLAQRFFLGDRPIVDEWGVEQLTGILLLPPFYLFYTLTHSTDGIILFFRALYAVCQMLVTAFLYLSLRAYGNRKYSRTKDRLLFSLGALTASVIFACFIPVCIPTLNYYSMSLMGLAVFSVTLFCYPDSKLKFFFCGAVFSAIILAEPASLLLYVLLLLFAFVVALLKKRSKKQTTKPFFSYKNYLFLNFGGYAVAIPVIVFIFYRCGFHAFFGSFHHLFDGNGYSFSITDGNIINPYFLIAAILLYSGPAFVLLLGITVLSAILHKYRDYTRIVFTIGLAVYYLLAYNSLWKQSGTYLYSETVLFHGIPLYLSGPAWMLLAKKPDKKICRAWGICALFSVLFSISSDVAVGWGGIAAGIFSCILATQVLIDIVEDFSVKKMKYISILTACSVICSLAVVSCNEIRWFKTQNGFFFVENAISRNFLNQKLDVKLKAGPLRGIYTKKKLAVKYDAMIRDLDKMKDLTQPDDSVFVCNLAPWYYLHLSRDYATYSTWFRKDEFPRLRQFWHEHPDKIPDYIYFPYLSIYLYLPYEEPDVTELKEQLNQLLEYDTVIKGEAGDIYHVTKCN
ncbi:MAG: hypothetical protein IJK89_05735 [Clostridia bacterium]|nr:hypothetical protein [Clostridia bacterium]